MRCSTARSCRGPKSANLDVHFALGKVLGITSLRKSVIIHSRVYIGGSQYFSWPSTIVPTWHTPGRRRSEAEGSSGLPGKRGTASMGNAFDVGPVPYATSRQPRCVVQRYACAASTCLGVVWNPVKGPLKRNKERIRNASNIGPFPYATSRRPRGVIETYALAA